MPVSRDLAPFAHLPESGLCNILEFQQDEQDLLCVYPDSAEIRINLLPSGLDAILLPA
jgi:hypothetical protein